MQNYTSKIREISHVFNKAASKLVLVVMVMSIIFLFFSSNESNKKEPNIQTKPDLITYKNCSNTTLSEKIAITPLKTDLKNSWIDVESDTQGAGVLKGEIPAINSPKFISLEQAQYCLSPDEEVFVLELENKMKVYPKSILTRHQIVNDVIDEEGIIITYSPFSNSYAAYRSKDKEFGVSGRLYAGNTLMYDTETDSLWLQLTGTSVAGDHTGETLEFLDLDQKKFGEIEASTKEILVLSFNTGYAFDYSDDSYKYFHESEIIYGNYPNTDGKELVGIYMEGDRWRLADSAENSDKQTYKYSAVQILELLNQR